MALSGVGGAASGSSIDQIVQQMMMLERQPVKQLETQRDQLNVRRAIYNDIKGKMESVQSVLEMLRADGDAWSKTKTSNSDDKVATLSAGTNPSLGVFDLVVKQMAQGHRIRSSRQVHSSKALGLSGTFVVGGAAARSASTLTTVADNVSGFGTAAVRAGERELGDGAYFVETREFEGTWQFRLVDKNGEGVRIDRANDTGSGSTSGWQNLEDVVGTTFDTGRGLTIDFGSGPFVAAELGSGAASVSYAAQGATITVDADDTLNDIRYAISSATYADGNGVAATIVDNSLVLSSTRTGAAAKVQLADTTGSVLSTLGFFRQSASNSANLVGANGVTAFGAASLVSFTGGGLFGQQELRGDDYHVEIGSGANAGKFRLLDRDGAAVKIASSSGGTTATDDWIAISDGVYDTGRGLTITFAGAGTYNATTAGATAARVSYDTPHLQSAQNAEFTLNGIALSRDRNSGLTNAVTGLTLNLRSVGSASISVERDDNAVTDQVNALVKNLNGLIQHIRAKTEATRDTKNSTESNPVYTQAPLARDYGLRYLRTRLFNKMLGNYSGALGDAPRRLADVGITLESKEEQLQFEVSDSGALREALERDPESVKSMFESILGEVAKLVDPYLEGEGALIENAQEGIDQQIESINDRIESTEGRLRLKEESYRRQFAALQAQVYELQSQGSFLQAFYAPTTPWNNE